MPHHATSPNLLTLSALLVPLAAASGSAFASDGPIVVEEVDLRASTHSRRLGSGETSTDATTGAWTGRGRCATRGARGSAGTHAEWSADRIAGELSIQGRNTRAPLVNLSSTTIRFTVPRRDRSAPDSGWSYAGRSPLEALYGGTPPTCTATIDFMVNRGTDAGDVDYLMPSPLASSGASKVVGVFILDHAGRPIAECAIGADENVPSRSLGVDLELQPGDYTLIAHCGAIHGHPTTGAASPSVEFEMTFENTGPGDGEFHLVGESERFRIGAGGFPRSWSWTSLPHDSWRYRDARGGGARASAGSVVAYESGGLTGFRHLRASQPATPAVPDAHASSDMELTFVLPHRMDVGIASLWAIDLHGPDRSASEGLWTMIIEDLDGGSVIHRQDLNASDVDPTIGFGNHDSWINLDAGAYRLSILGDALARSTPFGGDADLGFWYALAFEVP